MQGKSLLVQLLFGLGFEFSLLFVVTCVERSPFVESLRSLWYNNTVFRNIEYRYNGNGWTLKGLPHTVLGWEMQVCKSVLAKGALDVQSPILLRCPLGQLLPLLQSWYKTWFTWLSSRGETISSNIRVSARKFQTSEYSKFCTRSFFCFFCFFFGIDILFFKNFRCTARPLVYYGMHALSRVHKQEYATVISFLWARCAARCLHYIIQLQSAHCGKSNTALFLWFEMNFRTELEFTRQNLEIA